MDWQRPLIKVPEDIIALFRNPDITPKEVVLSGSRVSDVGVADSVPPVAVAPPINSPWNICPPPEAPYDTEQYLYQLKVEKNRTWRIMLIDSTTADRRVYCSGKGAAVSLDGKTYNGREFAAFRVSRA
jgi:hypothetical protein